MSTRGRTFSRYSGTGSAEVCTHTLTWGRSPSRAAQTYFHWDQGDYEYRDLQVGGSVEIDPDRNLLLAGHTRSHRGRSNLSGPSRSQPGGNALRLPLACRSI